MNTNMPLPRPGTLTRLLTAPDSRTRIALGGTYLKVQVDTSWINTQLGNQGLLLYVANNRGQHQGTLRVGKATVEWCKGKTRMGNGKKLPLETLIDIVNTEGS